MKTVNAAIAVALLVCLGGAHAAAAQPASTTHKTAKPKAPPAAAKGTTKSATAKNAAASNAKSVCVASAIGQTFNVQQIGLTIFENSLHTVAIGSWGLDDVVVRRIGTAFGRDFAVRRINPPDKAMDDLTHAKIGLFNDGMAQTKAAARAAAAGNKCDFFIAVTPTSRNYVGNQTLDGMGILKHGTVLFSRYYLFGVLTVRAFDGNTFEMLRFTTPASDVGLLKFMTTQNFNGLMLEVDKNFWPAAPEAAAHSGLLRNATRALIDEGMEKAMPEVLTAINARLE